jgi:hypothetical protein
LLELLFYFNFELWIVFCFFLGHFFHLVFFGGCIDGF